jgi:hypothetical protein
MEIKKNKMLDYNMDDIILQSHFISLAHTDCIHKLKPFQIIYIKKPKGGIKLWIKINLPRIQVPFFLLTHGEVPALPSSLKYFDINPNFLGWIAKNCTYPQDPRCFPMPLGVKPKTFSSHVYKYFIQDFSDYNEVINVYFNKNKTNMLHGRLNLGSSKGRKSAVKNMIKNGWEFINCGGVNGHRVPPIEFIKELKDSRFVASPRGFNYDC